MSIDYDVALTFILNNNNNNNAYAAGSGGLLLSANTDRDHMYRGKSKPG